MKRTICWLLSLLVLVTLFTLPFPAQAAQTLDLRVTPFASENTQVRAWYNNADGCYDLFFPADTDRSAVRVAFSGGETLTVGEQALQNGDTTNAFASDRLTVAVGGNRYTVKCYASANIPSVFIQTASGSLDYVHADKENKETAVITTVENGTVTIDGAALKQIKGRGNSTWGFSKKPYNIKFEKKTSMLGMPKAKKWTLLASVLDPALLRNYLALSIAAGLDLPYTSEMRHADLYINGEYRGNYIFIESVEIGDNRIEIPDLEDANEAVNPDIDIESLPQGGSGGQNSGSRKWVEIPNDPEDITGGYLLEYDFLSRYAAEVSGFRSNYGYSVTVKSPEYASANEVNYIADYYQAFEDALFSSNGRNAQGKAYTDYIDLDSFARHYVVQELMLNLDAANSSVFLHKDAGDDAKFVASPMWDFDYSLGIYSEGQDVGMDPKDPTVLYVSNLGGVTTQLYRRYEAFRDAANTAWTAMQSFLPAILTEAKQLGTRLCMSAVMDGVRWQRFDNNTDAGHVAAAYTSQVDTAISYLARRYEALTPSFTPQAAFLYYSANGGSGRRLEEHVHLIGDAVTVKNDGDQWTRISAPNDSMTFSHWNTRADGSGTSYRPGEKITLEGTSTMLYAQWRQKTEQEQQKEQMRSFWERIRDFYVRIWNYFKRLFRW